MTKVILSNNIPRSKNYAAKEWKELHRDMKSKQSFAWASSYLFNLSTIVACAFLAQNQWIKNRRHRQTVRHVEKISSLTLLPLALLWTPFSEIKRLELRRRSICRQKSSQNPEATHKDTAFSTGMKRTWLRESQHSHCFAVNLTFLRFSVESFNIILCLLRCRLRSLRDWQSVVT